jgi:hypothetical protein
MKNTFKTSQSFFFRDSIFFLSSGASKYGTVHYFADTLYHAERIDSHLVGSRTEWGGQDGEGASGPGLP